ncbi:MAG: hypothetical protein ACRDC5_06115 [Vibrio sp.]
MEVINKSDRPHTFGSVITAPDGETIYDIGEGYDVSALVEIGEIEIVDPKKKTAAKPKE